MKSLTKKYTVFLMLLIASHHVHAAKSVYQPIIQLQKTDCMGLPSSKRKQLVHGYCRRYNVPTDICFFIRCLVYDNPLRCRNKPLPNDLSEQDLSGFDFTGCHFTHTNLAYANLANVILTNTTCDYQKAFLENSKKNKIKGGDWYQENLPKDLKSIAAVYRQLNNNTHKAKLLQIACGLSRLPFYENIELYIKMQYWSLTLLQLKQTLDKLYAQQLICSLASDLSEDAKDYCWKTKYPQNEVSIMTRASHAYFDTYIKDFTDGLKNHQCISTQTWGGHWYKRHITKNIEGLQKAYPNIKNKKLQQTACDIAHALSKSYQIQQRTFLHHYLFYQNQLIWLKKWLDVGVKSNIHCSCNFWYTIGIGWNRGKK